MSTRGSLRSQLQEADLTLRLPMQCAGLPTSRPVMHLCQTSARQCLLRAWCEVPLEQFLPLRISLLPQAIEVSTSPLRFMAGRSPGAQARAFALQEPCFWSARRWVAAAGHLSSTSPPTRPRQPPRRAPLPV